MHHQRPCVVRVVQKTGLFESVHHHGNQSTEAQENSISGIVIDEKEGLVITHASIIAPFLKKNSEIFLSLNNNNHFTGTVKDFSFEVLLEECKGEQSRDTMSHHVPRKSYYTEMLNCSVNENGSWKSLHKRAGKLMSVFRCQKLQNALQHLMPVEAGWKFHETDESRNYANNVAASQSDATQNGEILQSVETLLPCFILIGLGDLVSFTDNPVPLSLKPATQCRVGDVAEVIATPFGDLSPEVFMNSYSKGVISNFSGQDNVLILTDARCIPGSEGGALYTCDNQNNKSLVGMIISPLCWKNNEWIGLALACSLAEILTETRDVLSSLSRTVQIKPLEDSSNFLEKGASVSLVNQSVVFVRCGSTWGSGVLIDRDLGLILTCSHVIRWGSKAKVLVKFPTRKKWYTADVIYCTPAGKQFDMALIQTRDGVPEGVPSQPLSSRTLTEGDGVHVIGYALFDEDTSSTPSLTSGVISKVTRVSELPILIQTTCAVHAGASGGAVTDKDGGLVGIVVCNAKDVSSGASFPHINLSVPLHTVWPVINTYRKSKDPEVLKALHVNNPEVQRFWNLGIMEARSQGNKAVLHSKL